MSKIITIAWREFKLTVFRKVFILGVLGIPVLIVGVMILAGYMMVQHEEPPLVGTIAIVDSTGEVVKAAKIEFDAERIRRDQQLQLKQMQEQSLDAMKGGVASPGNIGSMPQMPTRGDVDITVESIDASNEKLVSELNDRVRDGDFIAAVIITPETISTAKSGDDNSGNTRSTFDLSVGEELDSDHVGLIERRIGAAVVRVRAERANLDPDYAMAMLKYPTARTTRTLKDGEDASESKVVRKLKQMIPIVFMMLIWMGTMVSSQHLMMSTIEEKSNRVMEVLLSAVSPFQLMTGKILGHGGVGLLIVGIYSSVAIAGLIASSFFHLIDPMDLVYLAVFYFMAYFMIASIMAAVGSAVSDIREANTLITPIMMILMIPLMLWMPIIQDPNGTIATIFSFIPPAIPFAMILRLAAEEAVPLWQIPVSIIWGYFCVFAMIWLAAKIFRVGVLMYGKPPSPLQLIKWIRYS